MSEEWKQRANCSGTDPEAFFPVGKGGTLKTQSNTPKKICQRCSVRAECLAYAIEEKLYDGVWGGLDEDERRAMRREQIEAAASV